MFTLTHLLAIRSLYSHCLSVVFSLDSVITAVGLVDQLWGVVSAVVLAVIVTMFAACPIGEFVSNHPTLKVLALSFLILSAKAIISIWSQPTLLQQLTHF